MFALFSASAATLSAPTGDGMLVEFASAVDAAHHQLNRLGAVGTIQIVLSSDVMKGCINVESRDRKNQSIS
jgi:hypothetical protein